MVGKAAAAVAKDKNSRRGSCIACSTSAGHQNSHHIVARNLLTMKQDLSQAMIIAKFMRARGIMTHRNEKRSAGARLTRAALLLTAFVLHAAIDAGYGIAHAQDWPSHPVKIVVPYGPGGIADVIARITAERLGALL